MTGDVGKFHLPDEVTDQVERLEMERDYMESEGCSDIGFDFPEVVLMHIFQQEEDVGFIKNCRLVCKSWDATACRILRERTCVKLHESRACAWPPFEKMYSQRDVSLPLPFKTYHVFVNSLRLPGTVDMLTKNYIRITRLTVHITSTLTVVGLNKILKAHRHSIRKLKLISGKSFHVSDPNVDCFNNLPVDFRLNALTDLRVKDTCSSYRSCCHVEYFKSILLYSMPRNVTLDCNALTSSLMTELNNEKMNLARLSVTFDTTTEELGPSCAEMFGTMQFTNTLHILDLYGAHFDPVTNVHFVSLFRRICSHITRLTFDCFSLPIQDLPFTWPKLNHVGGRVIPSSWSGFSEIKFPVLVSVSFRFGWKDIPHRFAKPLEINNNVITLELEEQDRNLEIGLGWGEEDWDDVRQNAGGFFCYLQQQFPNVTNLTLNLQYASPRIFDALSTSYPGIKKLQDRGQFSPGAYTGVFDLKFYDRSDSVKFEQLPKEPCLLDLLELEHLAVSNCFFSQELVKQEVVTYGWAKMTKLTSLWLYGMRLPKDLHFHLPHVSVIQIPSSELKRKDELSAE